MASDRPTRRVSPDSPQAPVSSLHSLEIHHEETFVGPLPPPNILAGYNQIIPNGADRIMAMAERQSAHREALEASVVQGNLSSQKMGSIFAFILILVAIGGGIYLLSLGRSVGGLATIILAVGGQAGIFVYSRSEQRREREQKSAAMLKAMQRKHKTG